MQKLLFCPRVVHICSFLITFFLTKITLYDTYVHMLSSFSCLFLLVLMPVLWYTNSVFMNFAK